MTEPDLIQQLRQQALALPSLPGVYRMVDQHDQVLYVGKARELARRVASYFSRHHESRRIAAMVAQVVRFEVSITANETSALLLENQLIKKLKPRYNILFRDDKSYPSLRLSQHNFPRLSIDRKSAGNDRLIGPFASTPAAREAFDTLEKAFGLRTCSDTVFSHRSRPCLLYGIGRCCAPCVGKVAPDNYRARVQSAVDFLAGRDVQLIEQVRQQMEQAAAALDFEQAAHLRDRMATLNQARSRQHVSLGQDKNFDLVVCVSWQQRHGVQLVVVRHGQHVGDRHYLPEHGEAVEPVELVASFLAQHYSQHPPPDQVLCPLVLPEELLWGLPPLKLALPPRRLHTWVEQAQANGLLALKTQSARSAHQHQRWQLLTELLGFEPQLVEAFDISHTQGSFGVASCVAMVAGRLEKSRYRRFHLRDSTPGDDPGSMAEALKRHYRKHPPHEGHLLVVDGGDAQLNSAREVMAALGHHTVTILGLVKGDQRLAHNDRLIAADSGEVLASGRSEAMALLQQLRDEAHRFAISAMRQRRSGAIRLHSLSGIPGIGPVRQKTLLSYFGSLKALQDASVEDLQQAPGLSRALAQKLWDALHGNHE